MIWFLIDSSQQCFSRPDPRPSSFLILCHTLSPSNLIYTHSLIIFSHRRCTYLYLNPRSSELQSHISRCLLSHLLEIARAAQTQHFLNWNHGVPLETYLSINCRVSKWHHHSINCTKQIYLGTNHLSTSSSTLVTSLVSGTHNTSIYSSNQVSIVSLFSIFRAATLDQATIILKHVSTHLPNLPSVIYSPHWTTGDFFFSKCRYVYVTHIFKAL